MSTESTATPHIPGLITPNGNALPPLPATAQPGGQQLPTDRRETVAEPVRIHPGENPDEGLEQAKLDAA